MAFFNRKNSTKKEEKAQQPASKTTVRSLPRDLSSVLVRPHITEKAVGGSGKSVYTFVVHPSATKYNVRDAIKEVFKVTPVRVNIVKQSPRQYQSRAKGRTVKEGGIKKAYVYLKAGDSINFA